jgi:hypothetical protein
MTGRVIRRLIRTGSNESCKLQNKVTKICSLTLPCPPTFYHRIGTQNMAEPTKKPTHTHTHTHTPPYTRIHTHTLTSPVMKGGRRAWSVRIRALGSLTSSLRMKSMHTGDKCLLS